MNVSRTIIETDNSTIELSSEILRVKASGILNSHIGASAAIAYSKLSLANSIVNADISSSAAIAYSKLNLASSIVNADISDTANINRYKLNVPTSYVSSSALDATVTSTTEVSLKSGTFTTSADGSVAVQYKFTETSTSSAGYFETTTGWAEIIIYIDSIARFRQRIGHSTGTCTVPLAALSSVGSFSLTASTSYSWEVKAKVQSGATLVINNCIFAINGV